MFVFIPVSNEPDTVFMRAFGECREEQYVLSGGFVLFGFLGKFFSLPAFPFTKAAGEGVENPFFIGAPGRCKEKAFRPVAGQPVDHHGGREAF